MKIKPSRFILDTYSCISFQIYVDYFSRALSHEVRNSGVTIQTLVPFYVATNLTKFSDFIGRPSLLVPNAQSFVRSALSTLGVCDRTTGYWSHELQVLYSLTKTINFLLNNIYKKKCMQMLVLSSLPTPVWMRSSALVQLLLRRDALKKRK